MSEQDDIDSAAEAHQEQTERQHRENSGVMDPRCFTRPFPPLPPLTSKEDSELQKAQIRAMEWAIRRMFREQ